MFLRKTLVFLAIVGVAPLLGSCAGTGQAGGGGGSANLITLDEIEASTASDAYQLVQQLRPRWLQQMGPASFDDPQRSGPVVYVDGSRRGGLDALRDLDRQILGELRFLRSQDATTRFGTGHAGGAIVITLRTGERRR